MFEGFRETDIVTPEGVIIHARTGGHGPPLLLLHGYPQTHVMWHKVAPRLAADFTVVAADLRGYGDSGKPADGNGFESYCKRRMAADQVAVMAALGFERFMVAGHDRGGRVAHRMALDHRQRVRRLAVLDIVPTRTLFKGVNQAVATGYYHWFFLIQERGLPETMIGHDPEFYLRRKMGHWSASTDGFTDAAMAEYVRCFSQPETIHASCEDYRAAASIDLEHDEADLDRGVECPMLVLWGGAGLMEKNYDVLQTWRERASDVRGKALECGHFLPEEAPEETFSALHEFFAAGE